MSLLEEPEEYEPVPGTNDHYFLGQIGLLQDGIDEALVAARRLVNFNDARLGGNTDEPLTQGTLDALGHALTKLEEADMWLGRAVQRRLRG